MDVLQTLGVNAEHTNNCAASIVRDQGQFLRTMSALHTKHDLVYSMYGRRPSSVEIYGRGSMSDASRGRRGDLDINGLRALDIRTSTPDCTSRGFNRASDRQEAIQRIQDLQPRCLMCSPPCTAFSAWQNINHKKMSPTRPKLCQRKAAGTFNSPSACAICSSERAPLRM